MPPRVTAPHKLTPLPWEHGFCKSQTLSSTDRLLPSILSFSWCELVRICMQRVQSRQCALRLHVTVFPNCWFQTTDLGSRSYVAFVYGQTQSMRVISIICIFFFLIELNLFNTISIV